MTTYAKRKFKYSRNENFNLLHYVEWDRIVTLTGAQADWWLRYRIYGNTDHRIFDCVTLSHWNHTLQFFRFFLWFYFLSNLLLCTHHNIDRETYYSTNTINVNFKNVKICFRWPFVCILGKSETKSKYDNQRFQYYSIVPSYKSYVILYFSVHRWTSVLPGSY